ncbi:MAG: hypothetical protein E4H14_11240 [Candidatus Thorarchaeota archaeon]|nr:MAG: hypothetical protein E4H14_11240 [Candidatus Thorarchaeota archaeon]
MPGYRTIKTLVNDVEVFRPPLGEADAPLPVFQQLKDDKGHIFAYSWYLAREDHQVSEESRFIIYKKKGFTVGDTSRSNVMVLRETDRGAHSWATGEIHVLHDDIVPTSERIEFETNEPYLILEDLVTKFLTNVVKQVRDNERKRLAEGRLQKVSDFKLRFQTTNDIRERFDLLFESERLFRGIKADLKKTTMETEVKARLENAAKLLDKDISYMAKNLGAPLDDIDDSATSEPKRKTRRTKTKKVDEKDVEGQVGDIATEYSLDLRSRRLLAAVMKALHKTLNGKEKQINAFIENLRAALKSSMKDRQE